VKASPRYLLRDEIYGQLQEWIITGVLKPGDKVRDTELAERLSVSRTPVREALRRLEDEGLIETSLNRWTRVAPLDLGEADRIYPIIAALEREAVLLAPADPAPDELQRLTSSNERLVDALKKGDALAASSADYEFHQIIIDRCGNPDLFRIVRDLKVRLRRLEVAYFHGLSIGGRSAKEHQAVLKALANEDTIRAATAIEKNWKQSLRRFKDMAAGEGLAKVIER
jgi:DNA-binding GntR family transcriptional regulator